MIIYLDVRIGMNFYNFFSVQIFIKRAYFENLLIIILCFQHIRLIFITTLVSTSHSSFDFKNWCLTKILEFSWLINSFFFKSIIFFSFLLEFTLVPRIKFHPEVLRPYHISYIYWLNNSPSYTFPNHCFNKFTIVSILNIDI